MFKALAILTFALHSYSSAFALTTVDGTEIGSAQTVVAVPVVDLEFLGDLPIPGVLRLLGKGVRQRHTENSVALACYGEGTCNKVRFVSFDSEKGVQWIGDPFAFQTGDAKLEKALVQDYLLERTPNKGFITDRHGWIAPLFVFGVVPAGYKLAVAIGVGSTAGVLAFFAGPTLIWIAYDMLTVGIRSSLVSNDELGTFSVSQGSSGWSWASNPSKISKKDFKNLLATIDGRSKVWGNQTGKYYRTHRRLVQYLKDHPSTNPELQIRE